MKGRVDDDALTVEAMAAMKAGIAEANHRERGEFDGLLGQLPQNASILLRDIVSRLRAELHGDYSEAEVRALLEQHEPRPGYRNVICVSDNIKLALELFNMIRSAARCDGDRFAKYILGPGGARDAKLQVALGKSRPPRMPKLDAWLLSIELALSNDDLFDALPSEDVGDDLYRDGDGVVEVNANGKEYAIGRAGFNKRVTKARKRKSDGNN